LNKAGAKIALARGMSKCLRFFLWKENRVSGRAPESLTQQLVWQYFLSETEVDCPIQSKLENV
jgi:hypothetical protein